MIRRRTVVGRKGGQTLGGPYTPIWSESFNSYSNGDPLGGNVFWKDGSRTVADTAIVYGGSGASAKMSIRDTDGAGGGIWGGYLRQSQYLYKGDEIWVRCRMYWPSAFQFNSLADLKFLRIHVETAALGNSGYVDWYVRETGNANLYRTVSEPDTPQINSSFGAWPMPRDQWITYEMYVKFDNVETVNGGNPVIRSWIDGVNVQDRTDTITMANASDLCRDILWFTYWNSPPAPDNDCYCDDVIVATSASPPTLLDAAGRPYIGV